MCICTCTCTRLVSLPFRPGDKLLWSNIVREKAPSSLPTFPLFSRFLCWRSCRAQPMACFDGGGTGVGDTPEKRQCFPPDGIPRLEDAGSVVRRAISQRRSVACTRRIRKYRVEASNGWQPPRVGCGTLQVVLRCEGGHRMRIITKWSQDEDITWVFIIISFLERAESKYRARYACVRNLRTVSKRGETCNTTNACAQDQKCKEPTPCTPHHTTKSKRHAIRTTDKRGCHACKNKFDQLLETGD